MGTEARQQGIVSRDQGEEQVDAVVAPARDHRGRQLLFERLAVRKTALHEIGQHGGAGSREAAAQAAVGHNHAEQLARVVDELEVGGGEGAVARQHV